MIKLREAIEASWGPDTAYLHISEDGNPALGNCYTTSRIIQHYYPEMEIVEGQVWTGVGLEKHFWNTLITDNNEFHIDLTWKQFPPGSVVKEYAVRDRETLGDSKVTLIRVDLLLDRVKNILE